uniref:Uncharacterized protein n=1 Tax=Tanacetum cinerariifolium TaxID=118510 RepID=A0A6L2J2E3_TANCI|nr:hypothetical protein [Tanacetum cinerariifolium]
MVIQNQSRLGEGSAMPTDLHHTPTILQPSISQPQKTQKPRKSKRKNTQVPQPSGFINNVADKAIHKELRDSLVRAATTASSLEVEQDCVLALEKIKTTQSNEIASLKRWVKKLEKKNRSRTHMLKRLYKVDLTARKESSDEESLGEDKSKQWRRIDAIDQDEDITLVNVQDDAEMFDVDDLGVHKDLKTSKPKVKWIVIQEQKEPEVKNANTNVNAAEEVNTDGENILRRMISELRKL